MAYTLNRRLAELIDSSGQLNTGKIPNAYISTDHFANNSITQGKLHSTFVLPSSALSGVNTDSVSEGSTNLYFTNARADARIAAANTGDLSEGSNLYYTDARVGTYISGNRTFGNITTTGYIAGPASMVIDPAGVGDNTGTVVIAGNLQVDGTTTTINSTTVSIDDLNFTIAADAADSSAANGAGITIGGASATMLYTHATTSFDFNKPVNVAGTVFFNTELRANNISNKLIVKASSTTTELHSAGSSGIIFKDAGNGQTASLDTGGNLLLNGLLSAEDNIYLTDAGTVRGKLLLNSSDRDNVELRAESLGSTMEFFTVGTRAMHIDANQNIGIGTTSPGTELHVTSAGNNTYSSTVTKGTNHTGLSIVQEGGNTDMTGVFFGSGGSGIGSHWSAITGSRTNHSLHWGTQLNFYTHANNTTNLADATQKMIITGDGNVGIGTTSPEKNLSIGSSQAEGIQFNFDTTNNYRNQILNYWNSNADSRMDFNIARSSGATPSTIMSVGYNSNVGIGTTSPTQKLEVAGDIRISDARSLFFKRHGDNYAWRVRNESASDSSTYGFGGINKLVFEVVSNSSLNAAPSGTSHNIYASSANTLVLTEQGRVGIGTDSPAAPLDVQGSSSLIMARTSSGLAGMLQAGTHAQFYLYQVGGNPNIALNAGGDSYFNGGNVGIGNASPTSYGTSYKVLHVGDASTPGLIKLGTGATTNGPEFYSPTNDKLYMNTSSTTNVLNLIGSDVGIGTAAPAYKFDVYGTDDITMRIHRPSSGLALTDTCGIGFSHRGDANTSTSDTRAAIVSTYNGSLHLCTEPGGNLNSNPVDHAALSIIGTSQNVGIGTTNPLKQLEVWNSSDNDFVSVGVKTHGTSTYQGIHFGYAENNNQSYRKSAIVFERTDLTSNNAQGKVHILNGPQSGSASATLSDRKITIMENGDVEVPFLRAGSWSGNAMHTNGTDAVELGTSGGRGYVHGYDRTNGHYIGLAYDGVEHNWATSGGEFKMNLDATGNLAINVGSNSNTSAVTQNATMDDIVHTGTVLSNNGPVVMGRADGSNSGESGAASGPSNEPRCIRNWFTYAGPSTNAGPYVHMKTNLWGGSGSNSEFTMSVFTYHDYYAYGSNYSGYGTVGWHNWSGSFYNVQLKNYGNWNLVQNSYISSDGYVVLVAYLSAGYAQFSLDWAQWGGYGFRNRKITNVAQHSAATGKY